MNEPSSSLSEKEHLETLLKKERVMVVDDEEVITTVISRFFPNIRLMTFLDPIEALDHYTEMEKKKEPYTLIITDIFMPKMDGLTLLQKIRARDKEKGTQTKVIVMSGFGDQKKIKKAAELGATGFLDKPFHKKTLVDCLLQALKKDAKE